MIEEVTAKLLKEYKEQNEILKKNIASVNALLSREIENNLKLNKEINKLNYILDKLKSCATCVHISVSDDQEPCINCKRDWIYQGKVDNWEYRNER